MQSNERRPGVSAQVIYTEEGDVFGHSQRFAQSQPERETAGEAGSIGHGDLGQGSVTGLLGRQFEERGETVEMFAAGEVGHDATVLAVKGNLAVDPFAHRAAHGIKQGERGLVA